jgi:hypothetical protein
MGQRGRNYIAEESFATLAFVKILHARAGRPTANFGKRASGEASDNRRGEHADKRCNVRLA